MNDPFQGPEHDAWLAYLRLRPLALIDADEYAYENARLRFYFAYAQGRYDERQQCTIWRHVRRWFRSDT